MKGPWRMQLDQQDEQTTALVRTYDAAARLKRQGRIEDAAAGFRALLDGAARVKGFDGHRLAAVAIQQLADLKSGRLTDPELAQAEAIAAALPEGEEAGWAVRFGLGLAVSRQDPAAAMAWYDAANAMKRQTVAYDADAMDRVFETLARVFDPALIARLAPGSAGSPKPVFIVGMPRSGTTLVEQILASAPGIHAAGELTAISDLCRNIHSVEGDWPAGADRLTPARARALANAYLIHLHKLAPRAERVVDKMPANAQNVGLLMALFPNAAILHVQRDPLDTCFGIYRQLFAGGVDYAYDQTEIGRYHQGLMRLMDHWKAAFPGRIVDVSYPGLIADFEVEARRIVAATGMPWSDACLEFHKTEREIDTASAVQARRPLFKSGIGAADRFRPYLGALEAALAA